MTTLKSLSKISKHELEQLVEFSIGDEQFRSQAFPGYGGKEAITETLKQQRGRWYAIINERPLALLTLRTFGSAIICENLCMQDSNVTSTVIADLRSHLSKSKLTELSLRAPEKYVEALGTEGLQQRGVLVRLSASISRTQLLPLLPLSKPTTRDVPYLAKLMQESCAKSNESQPTDISAFKVALSDLINGIRGKFLQDSSLVSKAGDKLVSACLITSPWPGVANITELFTHPLYRARGLATAEISVGMNELLSRNYETLNVWVDEKNDASLRLFGKLNFKPDLRVAMMSLRI